MRTGENIYKRKDGRWEARYRKGRDEHGKIIYGYCYGKTYSEAKAKSEKFRAKSENILMTAQPTQVRPIFGEICNAWLQVNQLRFKKSTFVKYQTAIQNHILPKLGTLRISQITTETINKFCSYLIFTCNLAPKTTQDILVLVHTILEYGIKQYPGPYTKVEFYYPPKKRQEMRVLSKAEYNKLSEYLLTDLCPCKLGVLLALKTGIRIGELCALQWRHVNLQEKTIKIASTMQRLCQNDLATPHKTAVIVDSPKTISSVRTIPICESVQILFHKLNPHNPNAYILTGTDHFMEPRLLQYHFQRYTASCNLQDVTFHTLRHTFATRCVEVDFEIKSLSEILGHASTSITLNRYVHCSMDLKRKNIEKLETLNI